MFLTNNKNNNSDYSTFSNLNNNAVGGVDAGRGRFNFPTSIFENLLQNSDLLETLMKPISGNDDNNEFFLDEKMLAKKMENENEPAKIYGNAFLGPNLWNKDELFQSEKFGVRLEYLDVHEFLAENDMEDLDFLGEIENTEKPSVSNSVPLINNDGLLIETKRLPNKFNFGGSLSSNNNSELQDLMFSSNKSESNFGGETDDDSNIDDDEEDDDDCFDDDEEMLLAKMAKFNGDNSKLEELRKSRKQYIPNELKDEKYWYRRRKNNIAAKRSRDARRMKENQVALRAAFLERENSSLKRQLEEFKRETKTLKMRLSRYENNKKE